jgi:hypothetical protein
MTGQRRTSDVTQYKSFNGSKFHYPNPPLDRDIPKACGCDQSAQFVGIRQSKWGAHDCGSRRTDISLQYLGKCLKSRTFLNAAPHHHCEPAFCSQNPAHFAYSSRPVSEERETELAIGNIERAIRKRQPVGTGLPPLHRSGVIFGLEGTRDIQHAGIEVYASDHTASSNPRRCDARHNSCAASDVDYAVIRFGVSKFQQDWSPWPKNSRDQFLFVHLGRATGDLPLSLLTHLMIAKGRWFLPNISQRNDVGYGVNRDVRSVDWPLPRLIRLTDILQDVRHVSNGRVEDGRGSLGHSATLRFPSPLIEPDVPD